MKTIQTTFLQTEPAATTTPFRLRLCGGKSTTTSTILPGLWPCDPTVVCDEGTFSSASGVATPRGTSRPTTGLSSISTPLSLVFCGRCRGCEEIKRVGSTSPVSRLRFVPLLRFAGFVSSSSDSATHSPSATSAGATTRPTLPPSSAEVAPAGPRFFSSSGENSFQTNSSN